MMRLRIFNNKVMNHQENTCYTVNVEVLEIGILTI